MIRQVNLLGSGFYESRLFLSASTRRDSQNVSRSLGGQRAKGDKDDGIEYLQNGFRT